MSYKCICGLEFKCSNFLGEHKKECLEIKKVIINKPICYCGKKLDFKIHNGILKYNSNCGKSECRSKKTQSFFKGRKWSEQHRINNSKTKLRENVRIDGTYKCELCEKIFDANTSLRAHKASCGKYTGKQFKCDKCGKDFIKESGLAVHILNKHTDNWIHKEKMRQVGLNYLSKSKKGGASILEFDFEKEFLNKFEHSIYFKLYDENGRLYIYDFYIKNLNLIIEVDGDYWHINPKRFKYENMPKYIQDYKIREKEKQEYAIRHNYNIIRFWEYDIKNNPEQIKEELNKWLKH